VIGICRGARVLGNAGLLDGRRFTGHWSDRQRLQRRHPGATHVPNQRYLIDRDVATSTGITASVPTMLALVEAIGGRAKVEPLASGLGMVSWAPAHETNLFELNARRRWNYVVNKATAFWGHQRWAADVHDGTDDIALALAADAWERTSRISVSAASPISPVTLRSGLKLFTEPAPRDAPRFPLAPELKPMQQLDRTLSEIAARFTPSRHEWVLLEMEYASASLAGRP
jgi:putative intracellular protease/amidase